MRTRSQNRRSSWIETAASFVASPDRSSERMTHSQPRRRRSETQHSKTDSPPVTPIQPAAQQYPTMPSAPLLSSDAVLRNVAVVAVLGTLALLFLNAALYVSLVATAVLVPAWRTFKALEQPAAPIEIIEIDGDIVHLPSSSSLNHDANVQAHDLQNLHKYWVMAAFLFAAHAFVFGPFLTAIVPPTLYRSALLWSVVWMNANRTANAARLYDTFLQPALIRSEHAIDICVESVMGHVDAVTRHLILGVNQAVEPYARQLEHAAAATRRQMEEQAHPHAIPSDYFD